MARIKDLREETGVSQQALAVASGLSMSFISKAETGQRANFTLATLRALAAGLTSLRAERGLEPVQPGDLLEEVPA